MFVKCDPCVKDATSSLRSFKTKPDIMCSLLRSLTVIDILKPDYFDLHLKHLVVLIRKKQAVSVGLKVWL